MAFYWLLYKARYNSCGMLVRVSLSNHLIVDIFAAYEDFVV